MTAIRQSIFDSLGWLFCEAAFRGWGALPDGPRWWAWPADALFSLSYRIGCFFYGRGE